MTLIRSIKNHNNSVRWWAAALCLSLQLTAGAAAEPFRDGDRVCFIGDSITHQMLYHTEITLFYLTRFPDRQIETFNCGFAGDTAAGAVRRYDWDIAARKPTVATVMLGMNDVNRGLYKPGTTGPDTEAKRKAAIASHIKNMEMLAGRLHRDGVRLILIGPSPYDQTGSQSEENLFGVNDALQACGAAARRLAETLQAGWVDFNAPMEAINREWQARQPGFTVVGPDRVHPGPAGHLVMAYLFLKAQGMPAIVSEMTLDGRQGKLVRHDNCEVSDIHLADGTLTFTCRAAALPFPVDKACAPALEWVPFTQELNREMLAVTGLSGERYALEIDGRRVAETTAAALAKGINLAELSDTPQHQQAMQLRKWLNERAMIEGRKLRTFDHIEFLFFSDRENRTPDSDRAYLESKLAELAGKDNVWHRYRAGVIKTYFELLPEKDALRRRSAERMNSIRANVTPRPRHYVIRPVK
ncbi:MAG TPA: SGNH/GDSL hydrolase family protein [Kiritimatiellia bacterium]|nr:SGNH/GDSL hydrolase family protein [Kiritimatiellia bacterium]